MAYITREDGEHFVIPSYRDVLSAKQKTTLKKEILLLSQNYGEYITLQKKGANQYEVAFSPDTGYLLGESIWHQLKRPVDMVYCEVIPNTTEAILVIVKAGSVYLDGSFPLENIPEELIIFLTQQNNFEIYIYGDVPITEKPQEGKFSFDPTSVKSFTVLPAPIFPTLPLLKIYQLRLVEPVLKEYGIGVFPLRQLFLGIVILGILYMMYVYLISPKRVVTIETKENPYEAFNIALMSPAPDQEAEKLLSGIKLLFGMPGWMPIKIVYTKHKLSSLVQSSGSKAETLLEWTNRNDATVEIKQDGIYVELTIDVPNRPVPKGIYPIKEVIAELVDRISSVYPGNRMSLSNFSNKGSFTQASISINVDDIPPVVFDLIAKQFKDLPLVLQGASFNVKNGSLTGSFMIDVLGN